MSGALWSSSTSVILILAISLLSDRGNAAEKKAAVFGTPTANLRAGAGVEHALKLTRNEGDQVSVEKIAGEWFLVAAADGQKGYIHKNFLNVADETPAQATPTPAPIQKAAVTEAKELVKDVTPLAAAVVPTTQSPTLAPTKAGESSKTGTTPAPAAAAPQRAAEAKPQSILQIIEGHESEVKIAALVAAIAFVLGWFCGGSYYVRRERKARRTLRF